MEKEKIETEKIGGSPWKWLGIGFLIIVGVVLLSFLLYFSLREKTNNAQCIGIACNYNNGFITQCYSMNDWYYVKVIAEHKENIRDDFNRMQYKPINCKELRGFG